MQHDPASSTAALTVAIAGALTTVLGPVAVDGLHPMTGGASRETWAFDAVDSDGVRHELVLRRDPPGRPSAPGSMAIEAGAMRAARAAGVAVPEVLRSEEAPSPWGGAGIIMGRVSGEAVARRILRDERFAPARSRLVAQCGASLATVHSLDPAEVFGPARGDDPVAVLRTLFDALGAEVPTFEWALGWLHRNRPAPADVVVAHGDFRLGNLLVDQDGLAAVLDWELVHPSAPLEDLGWLCVRAWRFGSEGAVAGLGEREELIEAYEAAGGAPVDRGALAWWEVYGTLRWGAICLTQSAVHLRGDLRSVELAAIGRRVAEVEWDLLLLLAPEVARAAAQVPRDAPGPAGSGGVPDQDAPGGLHGEPTAAQLVEAVGDFLRDRVMTADDPSIAFGARVAANVVAVVGRELRLGPGQQRRRDRALASLGVASESELASRCRSVAADGNGDDPGDAALVAVLAEGVVDRVLVANPRYLGDAT